MIVNVLYCFFKHLHIIFLIFRQLLNTLAEPIYLTIPEIYKEIFGKFPAGREFSIFGKILTKHKFEKKRTKSNTKYKVYDIAPDIKLGEEDWEKHRCK